MEITSILIGIIFLGVSVSFVSLPFRKKHLKSVKTVKTQVQAEQRETVLSALRDLDFDFKTGKVSEEDYTPLRTRLLIEAAQYIEQEMEQDEKLEAMIQSRHASRQESVKCDRCGSSIEADQHFCAKCGSAVSHELCPHCGRKIRAGDLFCSSCGNRLEVQVEVILQS